MTPGFTPLAEYVHDPYSGEEMAGKRVALPQQLPQRAGKAAALRRRAFCATEPDSQHLGIVHRGSGNALWSN